MEKSQSDSFLKFEFLKSLTFSKCKKSKIDNSKKFDFRKISKISKVKKISDFDFQLVEFNVLKIRLNEGEVFVGRYSQA